MLCSSMFCCSTALTNVEIAKDDMPCASGVLLGSWLLFIVFDSREVGLTERYGPIMLTPEEWKSNYLYIRSFDEGTLQMRHRCNYCQSVDMGSCFCNPFTRVTWKFFDVRFIATTGPCPILLKKARICCSNCRSVLASCRNSDWRIRAIC